MSNAPISVLNIDDFRKDQLVGREEILFNQLDGKRTIERPHQHDFFVIILFEKGTGIHQIDSIDYRIGSHEVHVLFPGQVHQWNIDEGTIAYQIMVETSFFEQFAPYFRYSFTNYQNHPVIKLSVYDFEMLLHEFNAIKAELSAKDALVDLIRARAAVIAATLSKRASEVFVEFKVYQSRPRLAAFNMLIDAHFRSQRSVAFYAKELHVTANYLNVLCKRYLRVSAHKLIQKRIYTEANRLLQNSAFNIKEIAFGLGFSDHAHFSHFFKSQSGMTPSEFRRKDKMYKE